MCNLMVLLYFSLKNVFYILMARESAWCGRYTVTVDIDRFETDTSRQK
jgi:hypothetical protein